MHRRLLVSFESSDYGRCMRQYSEIEFFGRKRGTFIEMVRKNVTIFDVYHEKYKDAVHKYNTWFHIANTIEIFGM